MSTIGPILQKWFGRGPRTCLGKTVSLLEISKLVPMLVLEYDFEMAVGPGAEWSLLNDWFIRQKDYRFETREEMLEECGLGRDEEFGPLR